MTKLEAEIIERIKKAMDNRGLTQSQLAAKINLKQYQISRMLAGKPFPSMDTLSAMARELDVSLYYLIGIQEVSYRELTPDGAAVADAYQSSDKVIKDIVKRVLDIK